MNYRELLREGKCPRCGEPLKRGTVQEYLLRHVPCACGVTVSAYELDRLAPSPPPNSFEAGVTLFARTLHEARKRDGQP